MKRLQCLYRPEQNQEYPWMLKHPKVNAALALFKTRQEATEWYFSLKEECVYWFQNDRGIWAGQIISGIESDGVFEHEIVVDNFDGGSTMESVGKENHISLSTWRRNEKDAEQRLRNITDFKLISDPKTYFPAEDIKRPARKSRKDVEIEELRKRIELLLIQLANSSKDYSKEIESLKEELNNSSSDKTELLERIIELQKRADEEEKAKQVVVEEKVVEKEKSYLTTFICACELSIEDRMKVLVIYKDKLNKIRQNLQNKVGSTADVNEIKNNIEKVNQIYSKLLKEDKNLTENQRTVVSLLLEQVKNSAIELVKSFEINADAKDTPASATYYYDDELGFNNKVAHGTSYVLFNMHHVAFTTKDKYTYSVPALTKISRNNVAIELLKETVKEIVTEKVPTSSVSHDNCEKPSKLLRLFAVLSSVLLFILIFVLIFLVIYYVQM